MLLWEVQQKQEQQDGQQRRQQVGVARQPVRSQPALAFLRHQNADPSHLGVERQLAQRRQAEVVLEDELGHTHPALDHHNQRQWPGELWVAR